MKKLLLVLTIIIAVILTSCASTEKTADTKSKDLIPVTVVLDWTPNINHSGLYVAKELGYFEEAGLDVTIEQPADNVATQLVASGKADFGVSYQEEVTFARTENIPIVSIAAVIQHNTSCFAGPAGTLGSVKDFAGKTYGGWGGEVENALLNYLAEQNGFPGNIKNINIGTTDFFSAIESGDIDFSWIFYGVTGVEAELRDVKLDTIYLKDIDPTFDYYTPVLIASESTLTDNPELARKFLAATGKGYVYADKNPDEAAKILCKAVPELDETTVKAQQEWLSGQYQGDAPCWGYQELSVWQGFSNWLIDRGLLDKDFDASSAFNNDYLGKANK